MNGYLSNYMGDWIPGLKFAKNMATQLSNRVKSSELPKEAMEALVKKTQKLIDWARKNPKKAIAIAGGTAALGWGAVYAGMGVAIYQLIVGSSTEDELKKALESEGPTAAKDRALKIYDMMLNMVGQGKVTPEEGADVLDKIDDTPSDMPVWGWVAIGGGALAAIFLVWYMFRGKRGGKRRRRR